MEPANILFVIAFIGLPIAFGIWALVSRRELRRSVPPRRRAEPAPPAPRQRPQRPPQAQAEPDQRTRQLPATPPNPEPAADQRTVQVPAADVQESPAQHTVQMPPAHAGPPEPEPAPEPEPEERWSGSSGTTEELPIIGIPGEPAPEPHPQPPSQPPAEVETASFPTHIPEPQAAPAAPRPMIPGPPLRRPFYPPRYVGKSGGVVKRLTPLSRQSFLARRDR
jgi:hypothetical protein